MQNAQKLKSMCPQFIVADLNKSIEFYTKKLGFQVDFRYEDFYCGIKKDACSIHLKLGNPSVEEQKYKRNNEHLDLSFSVEDIETIYDNIKNKSVEIIQPLREIPYGRDFYIAEPNGYILAFLEDKNIKMDKSKEFLLPLQSALTNRQVVNMSYLSLEGESTERNVELFSLLYVQDKWLLIAFCRLRNDFMTFRLDGIQDLTITAETFEPHTISLREYFEKSNPNLKQANNEL